MVSPYTRSRADPFNLNTQRAAKNAPRSRHPCPISHRPPPIIAARTPGFRATWRLDFSRIHRLFRPYIVKAPSFLYVGKTWRLGVLTCPQPQPPSTPRIPWFIPVWHGRSKMFIFRVYTGNVSIFDVANPKPATGVTMSRLPGPRRESGSQVGCHRTAGARPSPTGREAAAGLRVLRRSRGKATRPLVSGAGRRSCEVWRSRPLATFLRSAGGTTWQPWLLSPQPSPAYPIEHDHDHLAGRAPPHPPGYPPRSVLAHCL
jgi:hypothetical protein